MSTAQQIGLALATVACAFDLRTRRIPQMVTLGGAAAGLVFQTVNAGWAGGAVSVTGWLVGTAVFLVPFVLGGLGAGVGQDLDGRIRRREGRGGRCRRAVLPRYQAGRRRRHS